MDRKAILPLRFEFKMNEMRKFSRDLEIQEKKSPFRDDANTNLTAHYSISIMRGRHEYTGDAHVKQILWILHNKKVDQRVYLPKCQRKSETVRALRDSKRSHDASEMEKNRTSS